MLEVFTQGVNMTVSDLYIHSNDEQTFIIFTEGATKPCFKGSLVDCPTELLNSLVYKFTGIDFNTIEVRLIDNIVADAKSQMQRMKRMKMNQNPL